MKLLDKLNNIRALQLFQLMRYGVLFIIRIALAKLGVLTEEIGDFEYFIFLGSAISFFWVNGLMQSLLPLNQNSKTFGKTPDKSPELFNAFLLVTAFTLIAIFALATYEFSDIGPSTPNIYFLLAFLLFTTPAYLVEYIYLLFNKPKRIIQYGFTVFTLQIVFFLSPIIAGYPIEYAYLGLVIFTFIKFCWLLILLQQYAIFKLSFTYIKEHLKLGAPLIIAAGLGGSAQYIDGFIIKHQFDEATFAKFVYGAKELPFVYLLANMLSNAMVARFSQESNITTIIADLKNESVKMMHYLFPISILLILLSNYLYPLMFRPEFAISAKVFNIYLLLIISRLVFPQTLLIGLKQSGAILKISIVELIINVTLSLIFIQWWGILGVAYATVIAYALDKLLLTILVQRKLKINATDYINFRLLTIYSVLLVAIYILVDVYLY